MDTEVTKEFDRTLATFNGQAQDTHEVLTGPATGIGEEIVTRYSTTPYQVPNITWELLAGQGRVRKAPELSYDTPSAQNDGVVNYDAPRIVTAGLSFKTSP